MAATTNTNNANVHVASTAHSAHHPYGAGLGNVQDYNAPPVTQAYHGSETTVIHNPGNAAHTAAPVATTGQSTSHRCGLAASRWLRTVLAAIFVTSIVELGLTAYILKNINGDENTSSSIKMRYRYAVAVSVISALGSLLFLADQLMRRMKAKKAYAQDRNSSHTSTTGRSHAFGNTHVANGGAKTDGVHHLGTMLFLALNFVLWTIAGALIEDSLGNDGTRRTRASSAFAWIPMTLSAIGTALAFHMMRRAKSAHKNSASLNANYNKEARV